MRSVEGQLGRDSLWLFFFCVRVHRETELFIGFFFLFGWVGLFFFIVVFCFFLFLFFCFERLHGMLILLVLRSLWCRSSL